LPASGSSCSRARRWRVDDRLPDHAHSDDAHGASHAIVLGLAFAASKRCTLRPRPARPCAPRSARGQKGCHLAMANRNTRPTSPGRRFGTYPMREELTGAEPAKSLTKGRSSSGGRNSKGRVTARHRGGGAKRRYRRIDFKRTKDGVPAKVASVEYDPNRSASIALLHYAAGAE